MLSALTNSYTSVTSSADGQQLLLSGGASGVLYTRLGDSKSPTFNAVSFASAPPVVSSLAYSLDEQYVVAISQHSIFLAENSTLRTAPQLLPVDLAGSGIGTVFSAAVDASSTLIVVEQGSTSTPAKAFQCAFTLAGPSFTTICQQLGTGTFGVVSAITLSSNGLYIAGVDGVGAKIWFVAGADGAVTLLVDGQSVTSPLTGVTALNLYTQDGDADLFVVDASYTGGVVGSVDLSSSTPIPITTRVLDGLSSKLTSIVVLHTRSGYALTEDARLYQVFVPSTHTRSYSVGQSTMQQQAPSCPLAFLLILLFPPVPGLSL